MPRKSGIKEIDVSGGFGWHYDRLPSSVATIPKKVAHNIEK